MNWSQRPRRADGWVWRPRRLFLFAADAEVWRRSGRFISAAHNQLNGALPNLVACVILNLSQNAHQKWMTAEPGPMDGGDALSRAVRWTPPPCLPPTPCLGNVCQCSPASFAAPVDAALPALTAATAGQLRIFFFDGHSGPLNDMTATLQHMNVSLDNMDAMLMAQAADKRTFVDVVQHKRKRPLFPPNVKRAMRDFLRGAVHADKDATVLPKCERKRCRDALYSDGLRREFANRFGAVLEAHVDVVACNFPTWPCVLFMHVNVAIVMRFTHRWDHHLQGYYVDPGTLGRPAASWSELQRPSPSGRSAAFNASIAASQRWRRIKGRGAAALREAGLLDEMPAAALRTLAMMAELPKVVTASNP